MSSIQATSGMPFRDAEATQQRGSLSQLQLTVAAGTVLRKNQPVEGIVSLLTEEPLRPHVPERSAVSDQPSAS